MVGDVVLVKENNVVQDTYRLAVVKEVFPGEDGKVRRVTVKYKNVDASTALEKLKFRETERSIHNIAVIVPADWKEEEIESAVVSGMEYRCSF